jgi:KDO2-lipid IV(A) lauroyltransferase
VKKKVVRFLVSFISIAGLRILLGIISILPAQAVSALGLFLSNCYFYLARKNRKTAVRNLEIALGNSLPPSSRLAIVRESFRTMGYIILDTLRYKDFNADTLRSMIRVEGIEHLETALRGGKGVIIASAHLGSFTLIGGRLAVDGYKATFVARHARNKQVEQIIMQFCRQVGQKILFTRPLLTCMRRSMTILSRNELLIIEMDQNFGTEGAKVNFFGQSAMVAAGPVKLALSTQAPIVPMVIIRESGGRHVIRIEPPYTCFVSGNQENDVRDNVQNITNIIEHYIRQYPGQWVNWIHKQWATGTCYTNVRKEK